MWVKLVQKWKDQQHPCYVRSERVFAIEAADDFQPEGGSVVHISSAGAPAAAGVIHSDLRLVVLNSPQDVFAWVEAADKADRQNRNVELAGGAPAPGHTSAKGGN